MTPCSSSELGSPADKATVQRARNRSAAVSGNQRSEAHGVWRSERQQGAGDPCTGGDLARTYGKPS